MPLDDTGSRVNQRLVAERKRSQTRGKPKPAALVVGRDETERRLEELLLLAKTAEVRAWLEYWAATEDERRAVARREKAKRAVVPDFAANPLPVGTVETLFSCPLLTVGVKVVRQADRVDVAGVVAYLGQSGVKPALLRRAVRRNSMVFAGAHIITVLLQQVRAAGSGRRRVPARVASA